MHVRAEATFPADPGTVAQMMSDEAYVRTKLGAAGASAPEVEVVRDGAGGFTVTTGRLMATDMVPAHFRSMVGPTLKVHQVETWAAAEGDVRRGTMLVEVVGVPVRFTGTAVLSGSGAQSRVVIEGELKASIPIFGGAVERAMAGAVVGAAEAEERSARDWLAAQGT